MQAFTFDHFCHRKYAFVALYSPVTNAESVKQRIIAASRGSDEDRNAVNFAFIDATLVRFLNFSALSIIHR